jgi:hypothetical protein
MTFSGMTGRACDPRAERAGVDVHTGADRCRVGGATKMADRQSDVD